MYGRLLLALILIFGTLATGAQDKKSITLADVWYNYKFYAPTISGLRSMKDGEYFTTLEQDRTGSSILKLSYETGERQGRIVSSEEIAEKTGRQINFDSYQFNADENMLLLGTGRESIYRHSSRSNYYIYNLESGRLDSLKVDGKQRLAELSPDNDLVAFVYDNRMHIQNLQEDQPLISFGKGEKNAFIAGAVDWVYEEEFSFHKGFHWSPEGSYIAYYQFDEREVPQFSMPIYGEMLYPREYEFKYPKAGEVNSQVSIHIFDVEEQKDIEVQLPEDYEYIPRIKWTEEDDELVIFTLNRLQNELTLWEIEVDDDEVEVEKLYRESAPSYLEIHDNLRFLSDGSFIWTSEKDGYNHLYHIDDEGEVIRQITSGQWEVTEFYGIDEKEEVLYYQAAEESPMQRHVYRIDLDGENKQQLSPNDGWNTAKFSAGFQYFILTHSTSAQPPYETLRDNEGKELRVINPNDGLKQRLAKHRISPREFFSFTTDEGVNLNGWMIKPQDFDPNKKYPLLMFVYGGPGSQTVTDRYDAFNFMWYQTLADQGYVIASVDNRGTGARGRDFRTGTYRQLGKIETEDQISAAQYLGDMAFIDPARIGIWGWSYGGYMSSLALFKGNETFKTAIAVAPVTNWRFYDNIYTERYMALPQDNGAGYDDNSPINHVDKLQGNYLLVHGSADDNVHFQNTMRMVKALVEANKQFDLFVYPDKAHGIAGGTTRLHLYQKMTDFITENL